MIASAAASTLTGAGAGTFKGPSRKAEPHSKQWRPGALTEETFARSVRPAPWRRAAPLLGTLLFTGALVLISAVSPPSAGVRRMLEESSMALGGQSLELSAEPAYALSPNWQWPALSSTPRPDVVFECETMDRGPC
jgi:hypothetical protein